MEGQCVFVVQQDGTRVLPIWPSGFRLSRGAGGFEVLDASGGVLAREGDAVRSVGGETVTEKYAHDLIGGDPPPQCRPAVYWVAFKLDRVPPPPTP